MTAENPLPRDPKAVFEKIYRTAAWGGGSGSGSSEEATRPYRQFLQDFLREHGVRSVVDVGCGDWRFSQHIDWTGIEYLGLDASKTALASARQFERPGVSFRRADVTRDDLPPADLLIAKDVLQHWSNDDILRFLPRLGRYRHALITNGFLERMIARTNAPSTTGKGYRPVDLAAPPFSLPGAYVFSYPSDEPKRVFHWRRPGPIGRLFSGVARGFSFTTRAG